MKLDLFELKIERLETDTKNNLIELKAAHQKQVKGGETMQIVWLMPGAKNFEVLHYEGLRPI